MRWPLRYQILFPFAGVMLMVVVGISVLDAVLAARRSEQQIERQLNEVATTLQEATFPLTDAVLKQTRGLSGAEFLLVDDAGTLRASSLDDGVDLSAVPSAAGREGRFGLSHAMSMAGRDYYHVAVRIAPRGTTTAPLLLHVLYPQDFLRLAKWEAAYPPLVVGGLLLVVVTILAFAIAGRLSRPILELRRQLGRLVQGEFRPLPLPQRNDELRNLIKSVNSLGDQLEEFRRAIKRSERLTLLGQLSGGLAHQLRNSVTGARMAVQLHGRRCHEIDPDSLDVALRQLTMTESHLQRFLAAGRPSAPRHAACDLQSVVSDVAALVAPACASKRRAPIAADRDCGWIVGRCRVAQTIAAQSSAQRGRGGRLRRLGAGGDRTHVRCGRGTRTRQRTRTGPLPRRPIVRAVRDRQTGRNRARPDRRPANRRGPRRHDSLHSIGFDLL